MRALLFAIALIGCQEEREPPNEAAVANRALSLERAANATVEQQIAEIEAEASEAAAATASMVVSIENQANIAE